MKKFEHTASSEQLALTHRRLIKEFGELYNRNRDEWRARLEIITNWFERFLELQNSFMELTKNNPMDTATTQDTLDQFIVALNKLDLIDGIRVALIDVLTAEAGALQAKKASLESTIDLLKNRLENPSELQ